ncbi:MAG: PQQ-binding-like beta-propeller repeat protein, partial [Verrucomicrobiota bacterium]
MKTTDYLRPALLLAWIVFPLQGWANEWGYWRGPSSSGAASEGASPPVTWSETEHVKWKVRIPGQGSGTPVVWGDHLFVQTAIKVGGEETPATQTPQEGARPRPGSGGKGKGKGRFGKGGGGAPTAHQFVLLCLERETGEVLWRQTAAEAVPHEGHHQTHAFGSHSPVTDGEVVIGFFGSQGIYGYDLEGKLLWSRDFGNMTMRAGFGEGNSAAISGDTLLVPWDHEGDSALYALDLKTGETRWKVDRPEEPTNWGSPLILEHEGKTLAVLTGETAV